MQLLSIKKQKYLFLPFVFLFLLTPILHHPFPSFLDNPPSLLLSLLSFSFFLFFPLTLMVHFYVLDIVKVVEDTFQLFIVKKIIPQRS